MANTRLPNNTNRTGRSPQGERGTRVFVAPTDLRRVTTANDNAAPLVRQVQRGLFAITAALALAWLFWVGFLR